MTRATAHTDTILTEVRGLLATAMPMIERQGLTLLGVTVANLDEGGPAAPPPSPTALDAALDEVRERFGSTSVTRAVLLGRGEGLSVPLLRD